MIGWLIAAGLILGVCLLPVGVRLGYDKNGPEALLLLGPVRISLLRTKKESKKKQTESGFDETKKQTERKLWGVDDFLTLLRTLLDFLGELRRKLWITNLEMKLILGNGDPCELGMQYGKAWAVLGNLMPLLESVFHIKKRNLQVQADFTALKSVVSARADVLITFGRAVCLALKYGLRSLKEYYNIVNKKKVVQ